MKVVALNGSARKNGNTFIIINTVLEQMDSEIIETEQIQLFDKKISPCKACFQCKGKNRCVYDDDDFNSIFHKLVVSDGIILGSPVYSADITSTLKAFLDRSGIIVALNKGLFKNKVGASVVAVRRGGATSAFNTMNNFLFTKEMFLVGSTYWNMVYGREIGEVLNDQEGIENMKNLGKNFNWLLKKLDS